MRPSQKLIRILSVSLAIVLFSLAINPRPAFAASPQAECIAGEGKWSGPTSSTGSCTYGKNEDITHSECSGDAVYQEKFTEGNRYSAVCLYTTDANGLAANALTLKLGGRSKAWVTFAVGACGPCTISATLPRVAKNFPSTTKLATLYVRQVSNQNALYLICFPNPKGLSVTIYKYAEESWKPVRTSSAATVCAYASGSTSFYLGLAQQP